MKKLNRSMALFLAMALILSLLPVPAAAIVAGKDYIVVGGGAPFSVYEAPSGTTNYSQYTKAGDYATMLLALTYIENAVAAGSTTITFGETFSSTEGPSGWCNAGSEAAAINGGGMSFSIGTSGVRTVKGKLKGTGDYVLSFQMYVVGIIDGAEIQSTSTSKDSCAVASIMSDLKVKDGSIITATRGSAIHMYSVGAAYIEGGTITGGSLSSALYDESMQDLNISGGSISSDSGYAVYNAGTGAVNISGGTISSSASNAVYNYSTSKITISDDADISTSSVYAAVWLETGTAGSTILDMTGGTVTNTNTGAVSLSANTPTAIGNGGVGTVLISGGTIQSTGFGVGNKTTGAIKISGGAISTGDDGYGVVNGSTGAVYLSGTPSISGGAADLVEVSPGTIHASDGASANYTGTVLSLYYASSVTTGTTIAVSDVKEGTNDTLFTSAVDGYIFALSGTNLIINKNEAKNTTTNTYYTDVSAALNDAADGETVRLLSDVERTDIITYNRSGVGVTLDLNGRKLIRKANVTDSGTASEAVIYAQAGTLTIKDTSTDADGYIKAVSTGGTGGTGLHVGAAATLNLLSGGILGCGQAITAEAGAHIDISGGVVYGYANVNNCEAINIPGATTLNITGGYIGTCNSGASMILGAAGSSAGSWSFSGGYFTSPYCLNNSTYPLSGFAPSDAAVTTLSTAATTKISDSRTYLFVITLPRAITFDATTNGGSCTDASSVTASSGRLTSLPTAEKSGKIFDGWYTAPTGGTKITTDYVFVADTTVFAQFVNGFTFNYYSSDGATQLGRDIVPLSGGKHISNYVPKKSGYSFNGWATTAGSSTVAYIPRDDYSSVYDSADPKPDSLSLYAIWDDISDLNGSVNTILSSTLPYSDANPDPQIGSSFTIGSGSGNILEPHESVYFILTGFDVDYTETDRVYLVDETASTSYYLGYLTREPVGTTQNTTSVFTVPQYVLRNGHRFHLLLNATNSVGGFGSAIVNTYMLVDGGASNLTDKSLSLAYSTGSLAPTTTMTDSEQAAYTINYSLFGFDASNVPTQLASTDGSAATTLTVETVSDTQVMGVTLSTGTTYQLNTIICKDGIPVGIISRIFYLYTYSYDLNGADGTPPPSGYVISDEKLTEPTAPKYSGRRFNGWYTDAACTDKWDFDTDTVGSDLKLFAGWKTSSSASAHTISVASVTGTLFGGTDRSLFSVNANMQNAFSSSVEVRLSDDKSSGTEITSLLGSDGTVYPFDISLYIKGTDTKTEPASGYTVTITMPLPEALWAQRDKLTLAHYSNGELTMIPFTLKQIGNVWCITFEADSFSPYALITGMTNGLKISKEAGLPYYLDKNGSKIYIGFAVQANGVTRYIETTGKEILFASNPKDFIDISGHWAKNNISFVTERELFLGTGNGAFSPDAGMTRAMFATVLGRLYERSYGEIAPVSSGNFRDVKYAEWYGKYVNWAAANGIITGVGNGEFLPNREITRQEMAAMLYRFAKYLGVESNDKQTVSLTYPDKLSIADWATDAAAYCQKTSIITGREGGAFDPQGTATRAEVSAIIERFINSILG